MAYFILYNFPTFAIAIAAAVHTFFLFDFLALKKKTTHHQGIDEHLWYSFIISTVLLLFFGFMVFCSVNPVESEMQGFYT